MREKLVEYDPKQVLEKSKEILEQRGCLPPDCPSSTCLRLREVKLSGGKTVVQIDSNPPQLPATNPNHRYEYHPICEKRCAIGGNRNRGFEVIQDSKTGDVISAKGEWKSDRI